MAGSEYGAGQTKTETEDGKKPAGEKGFAKEWRSSPNGMPMMSSKSSARKAASAQIAKIPFALSSWIAACYKPDTKESAA